MEADTILKALEADTILKALENKFCHAPTDAKGYFQGQVVQASSDGLLVQLFSWLDGHPTCLRVVDRNKVAAMTFYDDQDEWREAGIRLSEPPR